ncbi:Peptide_methionine sulfoxide reductase MsrB [Hexamita inflata]|uniref:peptide-methionine (R)-S-oxide reductase n=1 Tax=Hexamita inflata TaxID=28002 RepID=A0ABP1GWY9_9EUKA
MKNLIIVLVVCSKCGAHLGHVFENEYGPGTRRYCINAVCLAWQEEDKIKRFE